ncbi:MAG: nucleotide exchange factor GrpE [Acidobacteria bacterium]|nr:MAG: nucleotide exchange factor GrpE [Acidobacteriota bacterium]
MAADKTEKSSNRIPIHFVDDEDAGASDESPLADDNDAPLEGAVDRAMSKSSPDFDPNPGLQAGEPAMGGPDFAELVACRAELKRLEAALAEARETAARRQADFENYRKRIERERGENHRQVVADVARKLLPVMDNLTRALDAERTLESEESKEFRHFLHGVELISKQLNEVLESLGIQPIAAIGQPFDPHVHEAVVTEPSDEYEPDTVIEEIARGYRIGDRLLRPSMVKVAAHKTQE